jgi:hypothetical protein
MLLVSYRRSDPRYIYNIHTRTAAIYGLKLLVRIYLLNFIEYLLLFNVSNSTCLFKFQSHLHRSGISRFI